MKLNDKSITKLKKMCKQSQKSWNLFILDVIESHEKIRLLQLYDKEKQKK